MIRENARSMGAGPISFLMPIAREVMFPEPLELILIEVSIDITP